jgi:SAM-dependent methyltransferase
VDRARHGEPPRARLDHAFYLFDPLEPAAAEVARVLRPGGLFACAGWSFVADRVEPFASMMTAFGALTRRDCPHFTGWADRRNFDREALSELLFAAGFAGPLEVEEHALVLREPAEAIASRLMGFFYSAYLYAEETRAELAAAWVEILRATRDAEGMARLELPFALARIRKRA